MNFNRRIYEDKVLGGWLGKSIGGTLGMHLEGTLTTNNLTYYDPYPDKPLPNDDLDWQVIWLDLLLHKGIDISANDLREAWLSHLVDPYPDEYAKCDLNMKRGLLPPVCGWYNNFFINCMGSPIRSEVWAMICPGDPEMAAEYARMDASLDHDREGVYGEVFLAALESAAFAESNLERLIDVGLGYIPADCETRRAIDRVRSTKERGGDWLEAREAIVQSYHTTNPCYAPLNLAFMVIGLVYGNDFSEQLCRAVNCGYDTDCTGATVGSILGIIHGASSIPERWIKPVGYHLEHDKRWMKEYKPFEDIMKLSAATIRVGRDVMKKRKEHVREFSTERALQQGRAFAKRFGDRPGTKVAKRVEKGEIGFDYHGLPTLGTDEPRTFTCFFLPNRKIIGRLELAVSGDPELRLRVQNAECRDGYFWCIEASLDRREDMDSPVRPFHTLRCIVKEEGCVIGELDVALIAKIQWQVSKPVPAADVEAFGSIGLETIEASTFTSVELHDESVVDLFQGQIPSAVFAKRRIYFPHGMEVKIIADCSEPVAVWHEGERIICENKFKEIAPSAHRRAVYHKIVQVKEGWNTFICKFLRTKSDYQGYFFFANPRTFMGFPDIA